MIKIPFTGMTKTRSLGDLGTKIRKNPGLEVNYVIAHMGGGRDPPPPGALTDVFLRLAPPQNGRPTIFGVQVTFLIIEKALVKPRFGARGEHPSKCMENLTEFLLF